MIQAELSGRIAVVTGASRGIGAAVAVEAARQGAVVILVGRTRAALDEVDDEIRTAGGEAIIAPLDLTKREHVDALGGMLFQRFGKIDILVHAAGEPGILTPVSHIDPTELQKLLSVDVVATQHLIRSLEALLRASDSAEAAFLTCDIASSAPAYFGMAAAAKAGMEALVRSWRLELRNSNVTIRLIDPGRVAGTRTEARRYPGGSKHAVASRTEVATSIVALLANPPTSGDDEVVRLQSSR